MTANRHHTPPPPAVGNAAMGSTVVCSTAVRSASAGSAWWVLGAPVLAVAATLVFLVAGAPADWIGAIWLLAVLWMIGASLVQALWAGFRYGDWSAFSCCADLPCAALPRDSDTHDWSTRTGAFAYLRIRDRHEALMREGDRFVSNHDRVDSPD